MLNDKTLSEMMFDERNGRRFGYDANMLRSITHGHGPQLYVIHLYGQHFDSIRRSLSTSIAMTTPA